MEKIKEALALLVLRLPVIVITLIVCVIVATLFQGWGLVLDIFIVWYVLSKCNE